MKEIFITAEIGINHNGSIDIAKYLIKMAKECGCNSVKFQKRNVRKVIPIDMWNVKKDTPYGIVDYIDYKENLELGKDEYDIIDEYCKELEIDWYASAWDEDSIEFLKQYNLKYNKIASAMITNNRVLENIAKQQKLTFISTGFSTWEDIDNAVNIFVDNDCPYVLMHCVGLYPCPDNKLNLNMITKLRNRYDCEVGYSSHSSGILDTSLAVLLGANYLEKHITLDRSMWGSDQSASLERKGLSYVVRNSRLVKPMLGGNKRTMSIEERNIGNKLRYW